MNVPFVQMPLRPVPGPVQNPALGELSEGTKSSLLTFLLVGSLVAGIWWITNATYLVAARDKRGRVVEWAHFFDRDSAEDEMDRLSKLGYSVQISRLGSAVAAMGGSGGSFPV